MKYRLFALPALLLSACLMADGETPGQQWYDPVNGYKEDETALEGRIITYDAQTAQYSVEKIKVAYDGATEGIDISPWDGDGDTADIISDAVKTAIEAWLVSRRNYRRIQTLGASLENVLGTSRVVEFDDNGNKFSLVFPGAKRDGSGAWTFENVAVEGKSDTVKTTFDTAMFDVDRGHVSLRDWNGRTPWVTPTLTDVLLNGSAPDHKVLMDINGTLGYRRIGKGFRFDADGVTIGTNGFGEVEIKGWSDKGAGKAWTSWVIPASNSGDSLKWRHFKDFFDSSMFGFGDEDGNPAGDGAVVKLKGGDAETSPRKYFGTGDVAGTFGFHDLPRLSVDGKSIVTNETADGSASVKGAADAIPGQIPYADGQGSLSFNYAPPRVSYDDSSKSLSITDDGQDGWQQDVYFADISMAEEPVPLSAESPSGMDYTFSFRSHGSAQSEEKTIFVPDANYVLGIEEAEATGGKNWTFKWDDAATEDNEKTIFVPGDLSIAGDDTNASYTFYNFKQGGKDLLSVSVPKLHITRTEIDHNIVYKLRYGTQDVTPSITVPILSGGGTNGVTNAVCLCFGKWQSLADWLGSDAATHSTNLLDFADATLLEYLGRNDVLPLDGQSLVPKSVQDSVSHVTRSASLAGFDDAANGMVPVKSGKTLTWISTNSIAGAASTNAAAAKWTGSFSYFDGDIHGGCVIVGRQPIQVPGIQNAPAGTYRVKVDLGASPPTATLEQGDGFDPPPSDRNWSFLPVFRIANGQIAEDWRGSFVVPAWEGY